MGGDAGTRSDTSTVASVGIKTAFDVARPKLIAKVLPEIGVHGSLVAAAMLAEMQNLRGTVDVEACRADSRCCTRQGRDGGTHIGAQTCEVLTLVS